MGFQEKGKRKLKISCNEIILSYYVDSSYNIYTMEENSTIPTPLYVVRNNVAHYNKQELEDAYALLENPMLPFNAWVASMAKKDFGAPCTYR
jgi:hypothetical protein